MKNVKRYLKVFQGIKLPWMLMAVVLALNIAHSYMLLEQSALTADVIDTSQKAINGQILIRFIAVLVISAVLNIATLYNSGLMEQKINAGVRTKLWNKLMRLPIRYYDQEGGDSLVSRVTTDTESACSYFNMAISTVTAAYAAIVAGMRMYRYSPKLTLYSLISIPIMLILAVLLGKLTFAASKKFQVAFSASLGYLVERTRNLRLMKAARMEHGEQEAGRRRFDRQFRASILSTIANTCNTALIPIFSLITIVISFVVGGQLVQAGEVTVGKLVGFYTLAGMLGQRTFQLMDIYIIVKRTNGRMAKVAELLDTPDETAEGIEMDVADADINVRDVSFSYGEAPVLRGLNCRIPKGEVTAIIGDNGAGKSTLFKLLERMYDPGEGGIYFGGTNVKDFDLTSWRQSLAIVSQDKPLLSGTVRDNILYGVRRKVTEEELVQVSKQAGIYDFIMAAPGGFDAPVGMGGGNFSGGQRQCIAIARAMMRNPDYLLLDEATSNLDAKSEQQVSQALRNLMRGRTTVMIAHNYSAIREASHIVVLRDGQVEAEGSPAELLETNAFYREFVNKAG